jgi:hypothetical protein
MESDLYHAQRSRLLFRSEVGAPLDAMPDSTAGNFPKSFSYKGLITSFTG